MKDENKQKRISDDAFTIIVFFVLFAIVAFVFSQFSKDFLSVRNIMNILKHVSVIAIAALGLTFVIAVGHSDISFYMSACFSAMLMSWLIAKGWHPILCIVAGLLGGAFFGAISGIAVGKYKLPDIIVTIAIGSMAFGAAYLFSDGAFIYKNFLTSGIGLLNEAKILGIPLPVVIMLTLYSFAYILMEHSKYGRYFYATGSNKVAAFFSGIKINRVIIIAFIICSVLASMSTMITTAAQGNGNVKSGLNLLMPCFSAVYIGLSVFKKPSVIGTFLGAVFTSMMLNGFTLLSVPFYYGDLVISVVLIVAILFSKVQISKGFGSKRQLGKRKGQEVTAK
ncbi:MAG: ABC transporter permease [Marinisporobacter sp.]|jgi:simple sugar transport system permease protein/ribose transport system permease protein|nr:ABC transporter permease [Marinisporobacter sp.]